MWKRGAWIVLVVMRLASAAQAEEPPTDFGKSFALLSAPSQPALDRKELLAAFYRCAVELKVQQREMPRVVLVRAGPEEARIADVRGWGHVFIGRHPDTGQTVYLAWIVRQPSNTDLTVLFVSILNDGFSLALTAKEMDTTVKRLHAEDAGKVDVNSLRARQKYSEEVEVGKEGLGAQNPPVYQTPRRLRDNQRLKTR